jgi:hypothetical protein
MKDLTKLTEAFCLLDDETRKALEAHGGPYEWLKIYDGEWGDAPKGFVAGYIYRVKHVPVEMWFNITSDGGISIGYPTEAMALAGRGNYYIRTFLMREVTE